MEKIKLDPKSALFLEWRSKYYTGDKFREYLTHLDLSAAEEIKSEYNSICHYFDEVFINRGFIVENYIKNQLAKSEQEHLIIILAAGKSPLSLELVQKYSGRINKILEIDVSGMDEKKELYDVHYPDFAEKIKCITADFTSTPILEFMHNLLNEYYNDLPCIILLEGVSYYLSQCELEKMVASFKSKNKNNTFIFEYMLPADQLSPERKEIPAKFIETSNFDKSKASFFTGPVLSNMMDKLDAKLLQKDNLTNAEKLRTGENKYFPNEEDGWLECSIWQI
ncbi:MAG: hypothetical protein ACEPO8_02240 [Rhodothermaceae bacterium]